MFDPHLSNQMEAGSIIIDMFEKPFTQKLLVWLWGWFGGLGPKERNCEDALRYSGTVNPFKLDQHLIDPSQHKRQRSRSQGKLQFFPSQNKTFV